MSYESRTFPQIREGECKNCKNQLKTSIKYQWQLNDGLTYCLKCHEWTKTKFLEITSSGSKAIDIILEARN